MENKQIGRPGKSVYDMSTKEYRNWLSRNRITKEWILSLLETEIYVIPAEDDTKLTLEELINKLDELSLKYKNISMLSPKHKFIEGETLIFFDELQEFPEIATSLKFFKLDGRYDVICSGSLLGIHYKRIESNSVGHKIDYTLHSMDFEEFLWAKGYEESVIEDMYRHIIERTPFSELEHTVFMNLFMDYCILGGMPSIIDTHINSGIFEGILDMQRQLVLDYQEDVRKYVVGVEQTRILNVFNRIPVQLGQDNKKFQISKVASGAKFKDYWGCIEWLNDAGMINICYCLHSADLPLQGNYEDM